MLATFGYGIVRFPDGPIHPCAKHGYCGKQGQPHSQADFKAFDHWESALKWGWLPGMAALYLLNREKLRFRPPSGQV
jgi:hypothetical protein